MGDRGIELRAALAGICLAGLVGSAAAQQGGSQQDNDAPPPAVIVAPVTTADVTHRESFVGRIEAIQQVDLRARVEGFIEKIGFTEGGFVKTGDVLYEIEKGPYQAALEGAQASLAASQAAKAGAEAALKQADLVLDRQKQLLSSATVSQAVVDDAQAKRDEAAAQLQSAEAQIKQAEANVATAELNLSYTRIKSPIDGRIGKTAETVGNLVGPATGTLATVVQMNPIRAVFSIAERGYVDIVEKLHGRTANQEARQAFVPQIQLPNGQTYEDDGEISFVDNTVDPATGTIAIRANFDNPSYVLIPGQFVTVFVQDSKPQVLPMVPAASVLEDRDGPYVLVVDSEDKVQVRRIETDEKTVTGWAVTSGVTPGDLIIVSGIQKVRPGMVVAPQQQTAAGS